MCIHELSHKLKASTIPQVNLTNRTYRSNRSFRGFSKHYGLPHHAQTIWLGHRPIINGGESDPVSVTGGLGENNIEGWKYKLYKVLW